ncbi:Cdc2 cyclin-dependent kinase [Pavlovales sp. CCMP2436]|nr:Cdc2 cyclin-dependent kinase [Pavlovales sp. CCMP2436]
MARYQTLQKIGEGMYGIVYRALDRMTGEHVAIKRVLLDADEGVPCTAMREISLLKDAKGCDNIVRLLDIHVEQGALWLIFEHLECDLHHFLATTNQGLPLSAVRPLLYQLLTAVHHCHANRVLHRDIKPHNVLLRRTPDGEPGSGTSGARPWTLKLADFGLARIFSLPLRAYTHEVVTLWYRAPEILLGMRTYSWSVDVWSVACLLGEMLNGRPLFPGDSEIDQLLRVFRGLGTPNAQRWPGVVALPEWKLEFPKWKQQAWASLVPALANDPAGQDLIDRMLRYDPDERITAYDALNHPFFDGLDKELFRAAAQR